MPNFPENDPKALADFVHDELPRVYNLCLRLCQNQTDAEDLCQDVFVKAVAGLKNFRGDSQISTWLYRITLNTWKNTVRYEKRRKKSAHIPLWNKNDDDGDQSEGDLPENKPSPAVWAEISEEHRRLMKALDGMSQEEKSVIVLRDIEDKSYEDISAVLSLNVGTVKSRLSRARERLRSEFHRLGGKIL